MFKNIRWLDFARRLHNSLAYALYFFVGVLKIKGQIAVVGIASGLHGFVISAWLQHTIHKLAIAQVRQNAVERLAAQAAVAFGQTRIGYACSAFGIYASVLLQPLNQFGFAFFAHQLPNDFVLLRLCKRMPRVAEQVGLTQNGCGGIAFELFALLIFQVKLHCAICFEQLSDSDKSDFRLAFKRRHNQVALCQCQGRLLQSAIKQA